MAKEEVDIMIGIICDANINLKDSRVLDFFAKDGYNLTRHYASHVRHVTAWEIDGTHRESLTNNLPPDATIVIGDSYNLTKDLKDRFDIIVFDNPLSCYGNESQYCEHFDCIGLVSDMLKKSGVVVFNVKLEPYDYEFNHMWQDRRNTFYDIKDASSLDLAFVEEHYSNRFKNMGYSVKCLRSVERKQESSLYMIVVVLDQV